MDDGEHSGDDLPSFPPAPDGGTAVHGNRAISRAQFLRFGGAAASALTATSILSPDAAGATSGQVAALGDANVKSYGAVGNGVADDTAALQAAIDASQGVYIPSGVYKGTSTVSLRNGTRLVGEASGATPTLPAQLDFSTLNYTRAVLGPPGGGGNGGGVTLSNLWIRGSAHGVAEIEVFSSYGYFAQSQNGASDLSGV